jgi:hypothetical protein
VARLSTGISIGSAFECSIWRVKDRLLRRTHLVEISVRAGSAH